MFRYEYHIDGLVQERCNSIANAPELHLLLISLIHKYYNSVFYINHHGMNASVTIPYIFIIVTLGLGLILSTEGLVMATLSTHIPPIITHTDNTCIIPKVKSIV